MKHALVSRILALGIGLLAGSSLLAATYPFHTVGRTIVDANGEPQILKAVNWYGANLEKQVAQGLDTKSVDDIAAIIRELGYNSVRLTYSNAMIHDSNPVDPGAIRANPAFMGMTPLEVFDKTVEALARQNIGIMLNNHSSSSVWCCGYDTDGLWHFSGNSGYKQSEEQWIDDWKTLSQRYAHIPQVIAADLRNEVRTAKWGDSILPLSPTWGAGDENDWARAAERAGNEILGVNDRLLIIVEGINWTGTLGMFGGYRPHLTQVLNRPIQLSVPGRLVYAAHNYGYIGPKHNGDDKTSPGQTKYRDMDQEGFERQMEAEWGYVVNSGMYYTAPLIVSEFGVGFDNTNEADRAWFRNLINYMTKKNVSFAYWPLNPEGYGILDAGWKKRESFDWRAEHMQKLLSMKPLPIEKEPKFQSLNIQQASHTLTTKFGDWMVGANKGTCAENTRLVGMSIDHRALCTDMVRDSRWTNETRVIADYEVAREDWAGGFTKYTCPAGSMVIGYSKRYWGTSGVLCMRPEVPVGNSCHTVWFDRGDNRLSSAGGDFASGSYKGQCRENESVNGVAQRNGRASALLCCS